MEFGRPCFVAACFKCGLCRIVAFIAVCHAARQDDIPALGVLDLHTDIRKRLSGDAYAQRRVDINLRITYLKFVDNNSFFKMIILPVLPDVFQIS